MGRGKQKRGGSWIKNTGFTPQLDASRSKTNLVVDHQNSGVYLLFISDPTRMSVAFSGSSRSRDKDGRPLMIFCRCIADRRSPICKPVRFHNPHDCVSHFKIRHQDRDVQRRAALNRAVLHMRPVAWLVGHSGIQAVLAAGLDSTLSWHQTLPSRGHVTIDIENINERIANLQPCRS